MVAIVTGTGTGVENSSGWVLGSRGQLGSAAFGRYGENVYVNAATGNLSIDRTDEILIGQGPDDVISRNYNSLGNSTDDNGDNWRLSAQRLVGGLTGTVNTAGSTITRTDWDGSQTVYTWDATRSAYVSKSGAGPYDTLTYASNVWTWTDGGTRAVETYDATNGGRITTSKDTDGNTLTYTYTGTLLTRVTTADGEHTDLTWSGNNLTQIVTTLSGGATLTRVRYTYDTSNRLSTVTTDLSPNDNSISDGNTVVTTYTYDGTSNRVTSIAQTGGALLQIAYDASHRVQTLTQTISSGVTSTTTFAYYAGYTTITDANSQVTTLKYDSNNQLTEMDLPPAQSGATAQVIKYTYNSNGDVLTATDASGNITTYTYDSNGNLTQAQDQAGDTVTYTYGSNNQLLTQTQYTVPGGPSGNQAPIANNEALVVSAVGDSTTFDPRLNDSDPDNDALTITAISTPAHGTASIINGGTAITYTRTGTGSDSFTYTISDGHGHTATATITVADSTSQSNQSPVASGDAISVGGTGSITFDPRANDTDPDGDQLTITSVSTPSHGSAVIVNGGTAITYTRASSGSDSFTYTISDGHGHTSTATVTVSDPGSGGSNQAPTANNDFTNAASGSSKTFNPLANDTDLDGDTLTITSITAPTHGTASIVNSGTAIQYNRTSTGVDTLTYTISDGHGHTATATVTFFATYGANQAPVAQNDTVAIPGVGNSLIFDPRSNDGDLDLDPLTITAITSPTLGTATIINGGTQIQYTRSASGTDSFTYTISDGQGNTATATVTVTDPPPTNQAPTATNDSVLVNGVGDTLTFNPRYNDSDFDTDTLTITAVSSPSRGTAVINGGSTITYTRTSAGADSFTYTISDGHGHTATATVNVSSNASPTSSPSPILTTRYAYDSENHLRFAVSASGEVTEYDYNTAGQVTSIIVYRDNTYNISTLGPTDTISESALTGWAAAISDKSTIERVDTTYDFRGNVSTVTTYSAASSAGAGLTTQPYTVVTYVYDQFGNLLSRQTSGVSNSEVFTYDGLGRLTSSVDLNNTTTTFGFTDGTNTSTVTLASGVVTTSVYNDVGELISVQQSGSALPTSTATYTYDKLGQLRIATDPLGNKSYYLYDNVGRKVAAISADGSMTEYGYDASSRLIETISYVNKLNSTQLASLVDGSGNPVNVSLSSVRPTSNSNDEWNWNVYDTANRLIETIDGDGDATVYAYDGASNLISTTSYANTIASGTVIGFKTTPPTTLQLPTADATHDEVTRSFYDADNRLIATLNADGYLSQIVYNGAGQKTENIVYANVVSSALRASGTLSQLLASAGTSAQDRHARYFYDDRGLLRYTLDATLVPTEYDYDNTGNLIGTIAYAGSINSTTTYSLSYVQGQITSTGLATNANNHNSWAVYDTATGKLDYSIDANGGVTSFAYNAAGQVVKQVSYATLRPTTSSPSLSTMNSWASSHTADAGNRVNRMVYDQAGRVVYSVDAEGYVIEYRYDLDGRVYLEIRYPSQYTVTDSVTQASLATQIGSIPAGAIQTSFTYNSNGQLASKTDGYGSTEAATTSYTYDGAGNLSTATDARGNVSYFYYDAADRQILQIDQAGYATKTSYTATGAIASVTHYATAVTGTINPINPPTITTNANDATTSFIYDQLDRVTKVTDAQGYFEQYTVDAFGDRVSVTNKLGGVTSNVFDNRGLLISETLPVSSVRADGTTEASSVTNTFQYDAFGNRTQMVEASGLTEQRTTSYTYDKLSRLVQTTHDSVQVIADDLKTATAITPTETVQYDAFGNVIQTTDAAGAKTFFYYDHLGRKTAEVDAAGTLSTFVYDEDGNLTAQKVYGDAVTLPGSPGGAPPSPVNPSNYRQTSYTYDHLDRLLTTTVGSVLTGQYSGTYTTTTGNVTVTNYYDKNGNLIAQTDGDGNTVWYYYDKANRKVAEVDQELYLTTYTLDANGNVTTETRYATKLSAAPGIPPSTTVPTPTSDPTNDRITNFTYDKNGNRLTEQRTGVVAWTVNATTGALTQAATTATITYTYNGLGEVTSKQEATGDTTTYVYDSIGRQTSVTTPGYTDYNGTAVTPILNEYYDGLNDLTRSVQKGDTSGSNPDRVTTYTYGAGGRLASTTDASGFVRSYAYDADGRVKKVSYTRTKSDGTTVTEANATRYDALGRVVFQSTATYNGTSWTFGDQSQVQYDTFGEVVARGLNGMWQETNSYDNAGRVLRSTANDGTVKLFVYDANGNETLEITTDGNALPSGYDWSTLTISQALNLLTNNGANAVGAVAVSGLVVTFSTYDKRGQNTSTIEPLRQLSANGSGGFNTATITLSHVYNAFGEITQDTDGNGNVTNYSYNTEGKLIQTQHPTVSYTSENGAISTARPTENDYYDLSGRLVAASDANGNVNTRTLLAGTGYDGSDAVELKEFHPDTSITSYAYDVFGELRKTTNGLGAVETYNYDAMGRLTSEVHATRPANSPGNPTGSAITLTDYFAYDGLGQKIQHWNSQLGSGVKETTDYDAQGRVVKMVDMGGNITTYAYTWSSAIATTGFGTFGGWTKTTVNSTGLTETQKTDYFGRQVAETDFGSHAYTYTFNLAGELASYTNSANTGVPTTYGYFNTGLLASQGTTTTGTQLGYNYTSTLAETYQYDANGNRTSEVYGTTLTIVGLGTQTTVYHTATTTYDAMNRMLSFTDTGTDNSQGAVTIPPASVTWEYDLNGNIRHMLATYYALDSQGNISGTSSTQDYWYKYDALNRFVTTMGTFTGTRGSGTITRGTTGQDITYDLAGNRATSTDNSSGTTTYLYTPDGYLGQVKVGTTIRANYTYDAMGRVTDYKEYTPDGQHVTYENQSTYDNKSQLTRSVVSTLDTSNNTTVTTTTYAYNLETAPGSRSFTSTYEGGTVTDTYTTTTVNGSSTNVTQDLSYTFTWWEAPEVNQSSYYVTMPGETDQWTSGYFYDWHGNLKSGSVGGANPYNFSYVYNAANEITKRDQSYGSNTTNVHEVHYYFDGIGIGDISNNGSSNVDYAQEMANHRVVPGSGPFQNGATSGTPYANFDQSYVAQDGQYQSTSSIYTVAAGDTLQSIAYQLWGDSSFWYLIADANGLTSDQTLVEGQDLVIPNKVHNIHNNASTFQVYDPNKAQGAHLPTPPKPQPQGNDCGIFGEIIMVVVAVVVTYFTAGAASAAIGSILGATTGSTAAAVAAVAGAAIGAAVGSVVSQGVGIALGIQKGLNWKSVGIAALSAVIGGAPPGVGFLETIALDAAGNAITQGIAVATGLQKKFDWAGVAAAGIGGGAFEAAGSALLHVQIFSDPDADLAAHMAVAGAAGAIASAGARSLINGSDFGDNILAALPYTVGQTIGKLAEGAIGGLWNSMGSTGDAQSSGSQTGTQSTSQTGDDVNGAISQPAASSGASGQPVSQANSSVPTFPVETVDVVSTFVYDPDFLAQYWALNPTQHPNNDLVRRLNALNAPPSAYGYNRLLGNSPVDINIKVPGLRFSSSLNDEITNKANNEGGVAKAFDRTGDFVDGQIASTVILLKAFNGPGTETAIEGIEKSLGKISTGLLALKEVAQTIHDVNNGVPAKVAVTGAVVNGGAIYTAGAIGGFFGGPLGAVAAGFVADQVLPENAKTGNAIVDAVNSPAVKQFNLQQYQSTLYGGGE